MFNSKKSAIAMKDEEIKSLRKDIEVLNALIEEKDEKYNDLEAVYNFMKDVYESQLNAVVDAQNAQNDAEKQVDRLHNLNRILIAENEKLREGLAAISKSCTEYINYDGSEAIYGEDAHCKEVDDDNYDKYYNFNFEDGSYDDEPVSFDDDDDEDDFWDCDDPEEAIHDELFERNDDDDDDDYRDDDDYCYSTNIDKLVEENEYDEEETEEELTQEGYIIKSIGNIIECIGDIFDGKSDEEVIEKIDFATLCRAIIG